MLHSRSSGSSRGSDFSHGRDGMRVPDKNGQGTGEESYRALHTSDLGGQRKGYELSTTAVVLYRDRAPTASDPIRLAPPLCAYETRAPRVSPHMAHRTPRGRTTHQRTTHYLQSSTSNRPLYHGFGFVGADRKWRFPPEPTAGFERRI